MFLFQECSMAWIFWLYVIYFLAIRANTKMRATKWICMRMILFVIKVRADDVATHELRPLYGRNNDRMVHYMCAIQFGSRPQTGMSAGHWPAHH